MDIYISIAKKAVEIYINQGEIIKPPKDLPKEFLNEKAGVFVNIENQGKLRGCIGTYLPTKENIAREIIHNAIAAATEDYRFSPIQEEELPELSYTVYVLDKPEQIKSIDELDPKKYGILVKSQSFSPGSDVIFEPAPRANSKSGLLLPDLEGINTVEKQISVACQKGGINPDLEKIIIYRFTVEKFEQ
ncbi:MAG: AmmeMemoRadiSam system protein A [Minisyncoccales bacterium]